MREYMHVLRPLVFIAVLLGVFGWIIYDFVSHSPVFGPARAVVEEPSDGREKYLKNREKRNIKAMNLSYGEHVELGNFYVELGEKDLAIEHYYEAKTIFPERIEPRIQMCYLYLMQCQENRHYCRPAKRELYYAQKYVKNADKEIQEYLSNLVNIMDMNDVVLMDEREALNAIY